MTDAQGTKSMTLAPGVVDTIISIAAQEVDGVAHVGVHTTNGVFAMLTSKSSLSGIETTYDDEGKIKITLHIEVYYGYVLPDLAEKLRQSIADALLVQVGIEVSSIDIYIDGLQFAQKQK